MQSASPAWAGPLARCRKNPTRQQHRVACGGSSLPRSSSSTRLPQQFDKAATLMLPRASAPCGLRVSHRRLAVQCRRSVDDIIQQTRKPSVFRKLEKAVELLFPWKVHSREMAKRRLRMILISDRCSMNSSAMDSLRRELASAIGQYVELGSEQDVQIESAHQGTEGTVYTVTVPLRRIDRRLGQDELREAATVGDDEDYKDLVAFTRLQRMRGVIPESELPEAMRKVDQYQDVDSWSDDASQGRRRRRW